jgi:PAS domain S-box-containing protein
LGAVPRVGRFETQVRLVLILIVVFLAVLDLLNVILLTRARDDAERAERERAEARGREVARVLGPEVLASAGADRAGGSLTPTQLARIALRFDLALVAVWNATGAPVASSGDAASYAIRRSTLGPAEVDALRAGRAVASEMVPRSGGEGALVAAFVPVLGTDGRLASVLEIQQAVPELGSLQAAFRLLVAAQAAGVVLIGVLVLFFGRWVSRPYRTIAAAAGDAGLAPRGTEGISDPDDLATAFRAVAEKLREQERALGAMERGGGGLADLVRFASGAARGMGTGVIVVERRGRLAASNPAAEALMGLPPGSAKGLDLAAIGSGLEPLRDLVRGCLEEGRSVSREVLELRLEGGRAGHLGVTISPVAGAKGDVQGALVLMTDLTEIRQVQEQVSLREHLAAVGQLSAGIAHEFRNALGTILGYAKMLEKRDDPRVHGPAREILKEVDTVRAQIDEFLLYARPPEPQRTAVDLESLVRSCVATAPAGITVDVSGEFGTVAGDEGLLRRVFGNLLQNAADVGAETGRGLDVRVTGRRTPRAVQVEVDDDGPGIPPEKRGQVFLPFFTTRARGTGLGLAFVQRTLVDLGGSVEIGEGLRGGALFRLRLPVASGAGSSVTNRDSSSRSTESGQPEERKT